MGTKKPELVFLKKADTNRHRMLIPKIVIDKWNTRLFSMEVYDDKVVLIPILEKEK